MNGYLVIGPAYHRLMGDDGLSHPAVGLRLSEIGEQQDRVVKMLEQGGAIIVHSDDGEHLLGVLTRREPLLGEAMIAAMIDTGNLPPLDELRRDGRPRRAAVAAPRSRTFHVGRCAPGGVRRPFTAGRITKTMLRLLLKEHELPVGRSPCDCRVL